jgi:uncharacterized iron-regulated membrane protein
MASMSPLFGRTLAFTVAGSLAMVMLNGLPWSRLVLSQPTFPTGSPSVVVEAAPVFTSAPASSEYGDADRTSQVSAVLEQTPFYSQPQAMPRETAQRLSWDSASDDPASSPPTEEELRLAAMHAHYTEFFRRFRKHTGEPGISFTSTPMDAPGDAASAEVADAPQCSVRRPRARVRNVASVTGQP